MSRLFPPFVCAALLAAVTARGLAQAPAALSGSWSAEVRAGVVFLEFRTSSPDGGDWNTGRMVPIEEIQGLPANADAFTASAARFELAREAGTLAFDGAFRDGRGGGLFTFTPRAGFAREMAALGYSGPFTPWQEFRFAVHDVGPRYITALHAEGYARMTIEQVERAATHGVTLDYVRGLKVLGYRAGGIDEMIRTRDHGVTPDFVRELNAQGVTAESLVGYVRLRDHGIRGEYVAALKKAGYDHLAPEELVRVRDHGVTADYIADMRELGLEGDLTIAQLVRLRDHGVTPGFVHHAWARGFRERTADGLIQLKDRGLWRR